MTAIKMLENKGSYKTGDIANVTPKTADYLIESGYAEAHDAGPKRGRPKKGADDAPSDAD